MIIEITWNCPQCNSKELSCHSAERNDTIDTIRDDVFYVYCSECEMEYPATVNNSKIELLEG